ncbi:MAG: hypothetical protein V4760_08610 [Bdellovibrionota bacterium]
MRFIAFALVSTLTVALSPLAADAASFYVRDTHAQNGISQQDARTVTSLVRTAVSSRSGDELAVDPNSADYELQPSLLMLGESYLFTVEKIRGQQVLFAAQSKLERIDQLDVASRSTTTAAIEEPSLPKRPVVAQQIPSNPTYIYQVPAAQPPTVVSGTTQAVQPQVINVAPAPGTAVIQSQTPSLLPGRKMGYWTVGFGPFVPRKLGSDKAMYGVSAGRVWDVNPRASVKIIGEGTFSSGSEGARFFDVAAGANYFLSQSNAETAPYVTADFGYGIADDVADRSAEGFSFGTGFGIQFFRTTETTLDVLLRYAVILDDVEGTSSNPSIFGARLAVNF